MNKGQSHPASALSENLLSKGLLSLLEEKPFRDITVKELCVRSDIARRTFYRHFHTVEDDGLCAFSYYRPVLGTDVATQKRRTLPYSLPYFAFWKNYASLLELFKQKQYHISSVRRYLECLSSLPWLFPSEDSLTEDRDSFACSLAYHSGGPLERPDLLEHERMPDTGRYTCPNLCSQMPGTPSDRTQN